MAKRRPMKKAKPAARKKTVLRKQTKVKAAKPAARARKPKRVAGSTTRHASATNPVRELARRIVELTVTHEDEKALAFYADAIESVEAGMPAMVGVDAIMQKFVRWRSMVSDSTWQARNVWVDGNTIIIEWAGRVTFAATGKQADLHEVAIHEIENGKIVRERFYYDRAALQP